MAPSSPAHSAMPSYPSPAHDALSALWQSARLPESSLVHIDTPGQASVLPSSFDVATAAQASLGAAAGAAAELWHLRTGHPRQRVSVDRRHASMECTAYLQLDGKVPALWDKISGLYPCGAAVASPGWVRIHANFAHHRDGALRLLGLPQGDAVERSAVTEALRHWTAQQFEQAAADAGLVVAAARSFDEWDQHPQAAAVVAHPLVAIRPIEGAPAAAARGWPAMRPGQRPLTGLRVLDLTRILAGPVAARCLAAYGAEVLMVNGPHLPNIDAIADMSRGKRSCQIDLRDQAGRTQLQALAGGAHVFLQGYRPGALAAKGFSAADLAQRHPGIVVASLSAYGTTGPWAGRRGFDSLVQTATGFNLAEAQAAGETQPKAMPMQILDYAAGHLLAFGIQAALWHQATQGGSWQVEVSLARVAAWLRGLRRPPDGLTAVAPSVEDFTESSHCGFGQGDMKALRHAPRFSVTPPAWDHPSMPPGSHPPAWLPADSSAA